MRLHWLDGQLLLLLRLRGQLLCSYPPSRVCCPETLNLKTLKAAAHLPPSSIAWYPTASLSRLLLLRPWVRLPGHVGSGPTPLNSECCCHFTCYFLFRLALLKQSLHFAAGLPWSK